jgi:hypothetical protein
MDTAAIVDKAEAALREAAREHTRLSFAHRKAAAKLHRAADELQRALAPLGIDVQIDTDKESES